MQLFRNTPSKLWDGAIDVVTPAKPADVCNRISGQELSPDEERLCDKEALAAKTRELDTRSQFKVYNPCGQGNVSRMWLEPVWF